MTIDLVLPEDPALSPAGDRLAQLTLVTWEPGSAPRSETRAVDDTAAGLDMGVLAADREVKVAIELAAITQRLIGYGESPEAVSPSSGEDAVVTIQVRRPYVYASGSPSQLDAFDSTLDPGDEGTFGGIAVTAPLASAPTPDGAELVVVAASGEMAALHLISTGTHQPIGATSVPIAGEVTDVSVSPDGALALVAHGGTSGGLSVVDLAAARQGQAIVSFAALGPVGAVVAARAEGPDDEAPEVLRAFALLDRSRAFGCDEALPASSLAVVRLVADLPVDAMVDLGAPIADVAVSPDAGIAYLADPCANAVESLRFGTDGADDPAGPQLLFPLERAIAVAAQGGRVWGAGTMPPASGAGARAVLVSSDPAGAGMTSVQLPPAQERARSTEFEGEDQRVEVVIEADDLRPFELVALPGGDLIALLTEGYFHSDEWVDPIVGPVVSEIELTTFEYLLVQTSRRATIQRLRTWCEGTATSDAVFANFECGTASDQQTVADADAYVPAQLSALFGGR